MKNYTLDSKSGKNSAKFTLLEELSALPPQKCKKLVAKKVKLIIKNPTSE